MPAQRPFMPMWIPFMPIQRPTLQVATAVAAGALVLGALYSLAQSFNIQFQHAGGLQCPQVSLSGLSEGFIMWDLSPPGPGVGFQLAVRPGGSCGSPLLVLLQYGSVPSPVQAAPRGGQDVLDSLLPLFGPAGWCTRQPS